MAQSTDGARGKIGFGSGRHAWEIVWEGPLGTVAVIGERESWKPPAYVGILHLSFLALHIVF